MRLFDSLIRAVHDYAGKRITSFPGFFIGKLRCAPQRVMLRGDDLRIWQQGFKNKHAIGGIMRQQPAQQCQSRAWHIEPFG